jgi:CheY-like chemotaxis protein
MIEMAITSIGWTVDSAADGVEALLAVERAAGNLALVLANISMPKMTGIELAKAMREIPSLSRVPVVLMGPPEQRPEALAAGCSGFLAKPISMEALVETLNL